MRITIAITNPARLCNYCGPAAALEPLNDVHKLDATTPDSCTSDSLRCLAGGSAIVSDIVGSLYARKKLGVWLGFANALELVKGQDPCPDRQVHVRLVITGWTSADLGRDFIQLQCNY